MKDQNLVNARQAQNEHPLPAVALEAKEGTDLLKRQWIPVTERLPEYNARVLAIDVYEGEGTEFIRIFTREEYPDDTDGCWIDERGWWHAIDEVTHWMPLPDGPEVEK